MCEHSTISGGNSEGDPPVPMPNTEVKPFSADGTWLDTTRESRSSPDFHFLSNALTKVGAKGYKNKIFLLSSAVEHSAVNRRVAGSNPAGGAKRKANHKKWFAFLLRYLRQRINCRVIFAKKQKHVSSVLILRMRTMSVKESPSKANESDRGSQK